jgi:hypothetical protein
MEAAEIGLTLSVAQLSEAKAPELEPTLGHPPELEGSGALLEGKH